MQSGVTEASVLFVLQEYAAKRFVELFRAIWEGMQVLQDCR